MSDSALAQGRVKLVLYRAEVCISLPDFCHMVRIQVPFSFRKSSEMRQIWFFLLPADELTDFSCSPGQVSFIITILLSISGSPIQHAT